MNLMLEYLNSIICRWKETKQFECYSHKSMEKEGRKLGSAKLDIQYLS